MATPAEVLDLVGSLRSGGPVARARTAAEAIKTLRSLSVKDKRDLALLVAERTAPQLVPRIQAEGFTDLSTEQIEAVVDMVRNLDSDDVDDLKRTFTDPEARDDALRAVGVGVTAAAAAASADTPAAPDGDEPVPAIEDTGPAEPPPPEPDPTAAEQAELDRQLAEARQAREQAEREAEAAIETARAETERLAAAPREPVPTPAAEDPPGDTSAYDDLPANTGFDAADLATPRPVAAAPPAGLASARIDEITAAPDGWRRRRLVQRLIEDEDLSAAEVPAVIRLLGSATNRTWLAASAVEAGLLDLGDLGDLVDPRAAARLRRRYG